MGTKCDHERCIFDENAQNKRTGVDRAQNRYLSRLTSQHFFNVCYVTHNLFLQINRTFC